MPGSGDPAAVCVCKGEAASVSVPLPQADEERGCENGTEQFGNRDGEPKTVRADEEWEQQNAHGEYGKGAPEGNYCGNYSIGESCEVGGGKDIEAHEEESRGV